MPVSYTRYDDHPSTQQLVPILNRKKIMSLFIPYVLPSLPRVGIRPAYAASRSMTAEPMTLLNYGIRCIGHLCNLNSWRRISKLYPIDCWEETLSCLIEKRDRLCYDGMSPVTKIHGIFVQNNGNRKTLITYTLSPALSQLEPFFPASPGDAQWVRSPSLPRAGIPRRLSSRLQPWMAEHRRLQAYRSTGLRVQQHQVRLPQV